MPRYYIPTILVLITLCLPAALAAQAYDGLTLYNRMNSRTTRLITNEGQSVNTWSCTDNCAYMPYLLPDSTMLRPTRRSGASMRGAAYGGLIELYSWDGDIIWSFLWSDYNHQQHHDIQPMPNGNVLIVAWERKSNAEARAMGRVNLRNEMWPLEIVEYDPIGDSVAWEWHIWDHLIQDVDSTKPNYGVISEHPELVDINIGTVQTGDWVHANAVDYNEEEDLIVFSSHFFHEFYIIDHSTTTEEARGHTGGNHGMGGDILYRWGNPQMYDRGTGDDQHFFVVHGVNWIRPGLPGEGHVLIFNNGNRPGSGSDYSSIEEIVPPRDSLGRHYIHPDSAFGPDAPVWMYSNPGVFYANHLSGAFRMPNGNTFMLEGTSGRITEVTSAGTVVWTYDLGGQTGRAIKYPRDFTGVAEGPDENARPCRLDAIAPNPFSRSTSVRYELSRPGHVTLAVHDAAGRVVDRLVHGNLDAGNHTTRFAPAAGLPAGVYFARLEASTAAGRQVETWPVVKGR